MWQEANKEDNYECYHHLADLLIMSISDIEKIDRWINQAISLKKESFDLSIPNNNNFASISTFDIR